MYTCMCVCVCVYRNDYVLCLYFFAKGRLSNMSLKADASIRHNDYHIRPSGTCLWLL